MCQASELDTRLARSPARVGRVALHGPQVFPPSRWAPVLARRKGTMETSRLRPLQMKVGGLRGWAIALLLCSGAMAGPHRGNPEPLKPPSSVGAPIDPDTPASEFYRRDKFGRRLELVMSDEFTVDGRKFGEGDDPMWSANHNRDSTNRARSRSIATCGLRDLSAESAAHPCTAHGCASFARVSPIVRFAWHAVPGVFRV